MPSIEEYVDEIRNLWESHWLTNMGAKHQAFVKALEEYMGVEHLDLLVNGHMSLEMTMVMSAMLRRSSASRTNTVCACSMMRCIRSARRIEGGRWPTTGTHHA